MPVVVDADGYNSFDLVSASEAALDSEVSSLTTRTSSHITRIMFLVTILLAWILCFDSLYSEVFICGSTLNGTNWSYSCWTCACCFSVRFTPFLCDMLVGIVIVNIYKHFLCFFKLKVGFNFSFICPTYLVRKWWWFKIFIYNMNYY